MPHLAENIHTVCTRNLTRCSKQTSQVGFNGCSISLGFIRYPSRWALTQFCNSVSDYKQNVLCLIFTQNYIQNTKQYINICRGTGTWPYCLHKEEQTLLKKKCTRTQPLHNEPVTNHMVCRVYSRRSGSCWQGQPHMQKGGQNPHMSTMESCL